eukprot:CAMPEP_0170564752 /NCGR_PEP_ID=MMETSP0211-20121228/74750_1 /TAXON_ID=311385 /ORGANISM="Pseudokeronopsis sp., Strain OXSARD2" /LENGTH=139 /DNA_ID=CAMNT_0010884615 /DNA_START=54 /DNA_END=470 /DNA_ORIENTATION=+
MQREYIHEAGVVVGELLADLVEGLFLAGVVHIGGQPQHEQRQLLRVRLYYVIDDRQTHQSRILLVYLDAEVFLEEVGLPFELVLVEGDELRLREVDALAVLRLRVLQPQLQQFLQRQWLQQSEFVHLLEVAEALLVEEF